MKSKKLKQQKKRAQETSLRTSESKSLLEGQQPEPGIQASRHIDSSRHRVIEF